MVDNPSAYQEMFDHLKAQASIAFDTESNSLYAYHEKVCLIQLSSAEEDFLLDPFAFNELDLLGEIFANPRVQKVLHAGDYDLACLKRDYGFEFHNLFDTMLAATALAEPGVGLAALLEKYLGVVVDKKYQRADWGQRPLKPEMLRYGQSDSHYLLALRDAFRKQLEEKGRWGVVMEDSEALARQTPPMKNHEENLWRIRGVTKLNPKVLSLLQALNHLREELAEEADRPPFKVLSDQSLVEIAQTQPRYIQELGLLPSLSPRQIRRYGPALLRSVNEWRKNPGAVVKQSNGRLDDAEIKRRELLSVWRKEKGLAEEVPSNVILPRDLLEKIAAKKIVTLGDLQAIMQESPTRFAAYGTEIFELIRRKSS